MKLFKEYQNTVQVLEMVGLNTPDYLHVVQLGYYDRMTPMIASDTRSQAGGVTESYLDLWKREYNSSATITNGQLSRGHQRLVDDYNDAIFYDGVTDLKLPTYHPQFPPW